jgi:heme-degrading monooxygenase HmoA
MKISATPEPPYYAVIFTSLRTDGDNHYNDTSAKMADLARQQPGYLGHESARDEIGITVSYWESLESIKNWKKNSEHILAQRNGRDIWYHSYKVRICKVERDYYFDKNSSK